MSSSSVKTPEPVRAKHDVEEVQLQKQVQDQAQERQHHEQEGQQGQQEWAIDIDKVKTDFEKALKTNNSSTSPAAQEYHEEQRKFLDELLESERKASSTCLEVNEGVGEGKEGGTDSEVSGDQGSGGNANDVATEAKEDGSSLPTAGSGALIIDSIASSSIDQEPEESAEAA